MVQADSLALTMRERLELGAKFGPFRLFSIDGGHTVQHAINDLLLAQDLLAAGGVIFVDDYFHKHWPGVTEGVARFFGTHSPRVAPCIFAFNKLCLTGIAHHKALLDKCIARFQDQHEFKIVKMYGFEVAVL
jgi:cephalosporin hydroxylase